MSQSAFFFKQKTAYEISACLVGSEMCIRDRNITTQIILLGKKADSVICRGQEKIEEVVQACS